MNTAPDFLIRTSSVGLSIIIIIIIIIIISHSFPTSPLKQTYVRPPPIRLQTFRLEFATFDPPRKKTDHWRTKRRLSQVGDLEVGWKGELWETLQKTDSKRFFGIQGANISHFWVVDFPFPKIGIYQFPGRYCLGWHLFLKKNFDLVKLRSQFLMEKKAPLDLAFLKPSRLKLGSRLLSCLSNGLLSLVEFIVSLVPTSDRVWFLRKGIMVASR